MSVERTNRLLGTAIVVLLAAGVIMALVKGDGVGTPTAVPSSPAAPSPATSPPAIEPSPPVSSPQATEEPAAPTPTASPSEQRRDAEETPMLPDSGVGASQGAWLLFLPLAVMIRARAALRR